MQKAWGHHWERRGDVNYRTWGPIGKVVHYLFVYSAEAFGVMGALVLTINPSQLINCPFLRREVIIKSDISRGHFNPPWLAGYLARWLAGWRGSSFAASPTPFSSTSHPPSQ